MADWPSFDWTQPHGVHGGDALWTTPERAGPASQLSVPASSLALDDEWDESFFSEGWDSVIDEIVARERPTLAASRTRKERPPQDRPRFAPLADPLPPDDATSAATAPCVGSSWSQDDGCSSVVHESCNGPAWSTGDWWTGGWSGNSVSANAGASTGASSMSIDDPMSIDSVGYPGGCSDAPATRADPWANPFGSAVQDSQQPSEQLWYTPPYDALPPRAPRLDATVQQRGTQPTHSDAATLIPLADQLHGTAPPAAELNAAGELVLGESFALDAALTSRLRQHQLDGLCFIHASLTRRTLPGKVTGAILADSPGLGKTLTTIALLRGMYRAQLMGGRTGDRCDSTPALKCLLVAPATITTHWVSEVRKWCSTRELPLQVLGSDGSKAAWHVAQDFGAQSSHVLLVASYEAVSAAPHSGLLAASPRESRPARRAAPSSARPGVQLRPHLRTAAAHSSQLARVRRGPQDEEPGHEDVQGTLAPLVLSSAAPHGHTDPEQPERA